MMGSCVIDELATSLVSRVGPIDVTRRLGGSLKFLDLYEGVLSFPFVFDPQFDRSPVEFPFLPACRVPVRGA